MKRNRTWKRRSNPLITILYKIEDFVLNDRIDGVKKFKVNATPTIIINDKKFEKTLNFKNLKKAIEKLI